MTTNTPLLDRTAARGFVAVECPPDRHPLGCPHTPAERAERSTGDRRPQASSFDPWATIPARKGASIGR